MRESQTLFGLVVISDIGLQATESSQRACFHLRWQLRIVVDQTLGVCYSLAGALVAAELPIGFSHRVEDLHLNLRFGTGLRLERRPACVEQLARSELFA